jgi:hypothetical protein
MKDLLFSLFMAFGGVVHAQSLSWNSISVSGGPALPLGKFASENTINSGAGLARRGYTFSLDSDWKSKGPIGLKTNLRYQSFGISTQFYLDFLAPIKQTGEIYRLNSGQWNAWSFHMGPAMKFKLEKKLSFAPYIVLGLQSLSKARFYFGSDDTTSFIEQSSGSGLTFSWCLGGNLIHFFNDKVSILTGIDLQKADGKIKNITTKASSTFRQLIGTTDRSFSALHLNIGMIVNLTDNIEKTDGR